MTHLKLIINNSKKFSEKENYFFNKSELKIILNLYAKMVSSGKWKDYSLNISKKNVSFNVYKRNSENAIFRLSGETEGSIGPIVSVGNSYPSR